jgi:hypothetical protein
LPLREVVDHESKPSVKDYGSEERFRSSVRATRQRLLLAEISGPESNHPSKIMAARRGSGHKAKPLGKGCC